MIDVGAVEASRAALKHRGWPSILLAIYSATIILRHLQDDAAEQFAAMGFSGHTMPADISEFALMVVTEQQHRDKGCWDLASTMLT